MAIGVNFWAREDCLLSVAEHVYIALYAYGITNFGSCSHDTFAPGRCEPSYLSIYGESCRKLKFHGAKVP